MKTLFRSVAVLTLACFFTTGCIIGGSGDDNSDPGDNNEPGPQTEDPKPKPPENTDPVVTPNLSDTVYIN